MNKSGFKRAYKSAIASLSFSAELRKMRRELNARIDMPDTIVAPPASHASGVNRWFTRRRISIAESYLTVVSDLDSRHCRARLEALRVLMDASFHSKALDMPLNTARVQMALMKEVVKNRHNKRRQLELLHDFSISTYGQKQVITRLCDELNIVVLPENGTTLEDFDYGWDDHVHDTATSGRKNPTQLVIDAFIKGISELTVAYGSLADQELMEEILEAGRIMGVRINIGFEFSANARGRRFHFMALLPRMRAPADIRAFSRRNAAGLGEFFKGLEQNQVSRVEAVRGVLQEFNATALPEINRGFPDDPLYRVPELSVEALNAFIPTMSINRTHLAEFLYGKMRPVMLNRLLLLKMLRSKAADACARGVGDGAARDEAEKAYADMKKDYKKISPDGLLARYFSGPALIDYQSAFDDLRTAKARLKAAGCRLKILHPLEHGIGEAIALLEEQRGTIDVVEIYNIQDCITRDQEEVLRFARAVNALNEIAQRDRTAAFAPVCGSDSTGRHPKIPGMGFIRQERITGKKRDEYLKRHITLPALLSAMIGAKGEPVEEARAGTASPIVCLGKLAESAAAADEASESAYISPRRVWRYLNPGLKNAVFMTIGFLVANRFIGWAYALLWLCITGFRNSIADLVASRGSRLSEWKLRSINFANVAQSMFWTGFSVPILSFVKAGFDAAWPWAKDGLGFNLIKFFVISFANGLYLATHNTLRGFDRKVVRINFFRSIIAWPFAALGAPLGNLLSIPSIVQTKIWSDFVAGFIEGSGKFITILKLRRKSIEEIIPRILQADGEEKYVATLDLLYLFREEPRTRNSLIDLFGLKRRVPLAPRQLARRKGARAGGGTAVPTWSIADLLGSLDQPRFDEGLTDFILSRYEEEMATDLVDLAADTLPPLRRWLAERAG